MRITKPSPPPVAPLTRNSYDGFLTGAGFHKVLTQVFELGEQAGRIVIHQKDDGLRFEAQGVRQFRHVPTPWDAPVAEVENKTGFDAGRTFFSHPAVGTG